MKSLLKFALAGLLVALTLAAAPRAKADDIVDIAVADGKGAKPEFTILVKAVTAAGLVDTLKSEGPFTVFAPTDAAFKKLEKAKPGTLAMLLKPENKAKLVAILTYHVLKGKVEAKDALALKNGTKVATVEGKEIVVMHDAKGVMINKSRVIKADIEASNGVIHVIDTVLLPPADKMMK